MPGYWQTDYWPNSASGAYWPTDYWQEYGTEEPPPHTVVVSSYSSGRIVAIFGLVFGGAS